MIQTAEGSNCQQTALPRRSHEIQTKMIVCGTYLVACMLLKRAANHSTPRWCDRTTHSNPVGRPATRSAAIFGKGTDIINSRHLWQRSSQVASAIHQRDMDILKQGCDGTRMHGTAVYDNSWLRHCGAHLWLYTDAAFDSHWTWILLIVCLVFLQHLTHVTSGAFWTHSTQQLAMHSLVMSHPAATGLLWENLKPWASKRDARGL